MATQTKDELQAMVRRRIATAVIFGFAMVYAAWVYAPINVPTDPTLTVRLVFALRWLALSLTPMIFGIHLILNTRYTNMDTAGVMTTSPYSEELVRLRQRCLQNTLEQTALHVPIVLILSTYLDASTLKLVPILVCLFVFARITFFIGYLAMGDLARAFGFAMTFFSNMIPLIFCLYQLFTGGANYGLK